MTSSQGFQTQVNVQPAPAVEGDFANGNPRFVVPAAQGGLVAGAAGVIVGRFAWANYTAADSDGAPAVVSNNGAGPVTGFVHREQQGLIVDYLSEASLKIQPGFAVTLYDGGDFFVKNTGSNQALPGMKAYANFADGKVTFAATGSASTASATGSIAAGAGASATGTIVGNIFTATAALSGTFVIGGVLTGTGVATGTTIVSQLSGTAGGLGTYAVSIPEQNVTSTTISETWGVFTAASALVGTFGVGDSLSGPGGSSDPVADGTVITALGTGTGGLGTYIVNKTQTSSSATVTAATSVETKWVAMSSGLTNELVKISSQPLG